MQLGAKLPATVPIETFFLLTHTLPIPISLSNMSTPKSLITTLQNVEYFDLDKGGVIWPIATHRGMGGTWIYIAMSNLCFSLTIPLALGRRSNLQLFISFASHRRPLLPAFPAF